MSTVTPPSLTAEYESVWTTTTSPKTVSVTVVTGDVLAILAVSGDDATPLVTPTGGGLTYTLRQSVTTVDFCQTYLWTVDPVGSGQTFTLSVTKSGIGTDLWGFNCLRWAGSDGVGASAKTTGASGAPALDLASTVDHSAVVVAVGDWTALDGAARVWRQGSVSLTEVSYSSNVGVYTVYGGYYPDLPAGGNTLTTGLTAPGAQKYSIAAVEIKGRLDLTSPATPSPLAVVRHFAPIRRK